MTLEDPFKIKTISQIIEEYQDIENIEIIFIINDLLQYVFKSNNQTCEGYFSICEEDDMTVLEVCRESCKVSLSYEVIYKIQFKKSIDSDEIRTSEQIRYN